MAYCVYKLTLCLMMVCFFYLSLLAQSPIQFTDANDSYLIGTQIHILEDTFAIHNLQTICKPETQTRFKPLTQSIFGSPATHSVFWLKIQVQNSSGQDTWLNINTHLIDQITLYRPSFDSLSVIQTGAKYEQNTKFYPVNTFWLPINQAQDTTVQTYYLQIKSEMGITCPIYIGTMSSLHLRKDQNDALMFIFIGVMVIMFFYNLFIYFSTRDTIYLFYLGYVFMASLQASFNSNYPFIYQLGFDVIPTTWWYNHYFIWTMPNYVFVGIFCIRYLDLYENAPKITWFLLGQMACFIFIYPFISLVGISKIDVEGWYNLSVLSYDLTYLLAGYYLYFKKGQRKARFYILSWTILVMSVFILILTTMGILPFNIFTINSVLFGIMSEVWLFSLALGDRINTLQKENQLLVEEQNEILTRKVNEKTYALQQANEELAVNNEELQQSQEEIASQRDILEMSNKELQEYKYRVSQSIESAQLIQNTILPSDISIARHFANFFILYLPKDVVSGDFYWMCHFKKQTIFIEADCTGHGVSGAFMTLIGHSLLNQIIKFERIYNPTQVMEELHRRLRDILRQDETHNDEGMDLCMLVLQKGKNAWQVEFGGTGQKFYYVKNQTIQFLKGSSKRIGGRYYTRKKFQTHSLILPEGTNLYLCSDGYIDQNDKHREKFGSERFLKLLQNIQNQSFEEQKIKLQKTLLIHQKETEQRDDITIIGLKL